MNKKGTLSLIEQSVMLLVFAVAAALCLNAFFHSDRVAKENYARDRAVLCVQNMAEELKACGAELGDTDKVFEAAAKKTDAQRVEKTLTVYYGADWGPICAEEAVYRLCAAQADAPEGICKADVWVESVHGGEALFRVSVAWQKGAEI